MMRHDPIHAATVTLQKELQVRALFRVPVLSGGSGTGIHTISPLAYVESRKEGCKYLFRLLQTYENTSGVTLAAAKEDAIKLIVQSLGEPTTYEVDNVIALKAVAQLENEVAFDLVKTYAAGNLVNFQDWLAKHPGTLKNLGLDEEGLTHKVRLLNLAYICAGHRTVDFATIAKSLSIPVDSIEEWIIDLIRVGLVEAKVDQVNSQVVVR